SVSVVLPASGWLMIANVRRRWASWTTDDTVSRLPTVATGAAQSAVVSDPRADHAVSIAASRSAAVARNSAATPLASRLSTLRVPTWLSNGPTAAALTTNVTSAADAIGDSIESVSAAVQMPRAWSSAWAS